MKLCMDLLNAAFIFMGILSALLSNHYSSIVMGDAALGVAVLAPEEGSKEMNTKRHQLQLGNRWFQLGLLFSILALICQVISALGK